MLGGAWFGQSFGDPVAVAPALLLQRAQVAVREQLGLEPAPTRSIVKVHQVGDGTAGQQGLGGSWGGSHRAHRLLPPVPQACIPQYTLGHWQRIGKRGPGPGGSPAPAEVPTAHPHPRRAHQPLPGRAAAAPQPHRGLLHRRLRQRLHRQCQSGRWAAAGAAALSPSVPASPPGTQQLHGSRTKCFFN